MNNNCKTTNWKAIVVGSTLNLRIEKGHVASDYKLSADVALSQLAFRPDIICNWEDMEGCDSGDYRKQLENDYIRAAATDDRQGRGVSCWVRREYVIEKVYSMSSPHFMHVRVINAGIELNLLILRIPVSDSSAEDFKERWKQWEMAMIYLDSIAGTAKNIALMGDWNHGVIGTMESYLGKPRQFYNFQKIQSSLTQRSLPIVPIEGMSYKGYMAIDHLAVSSAVSVENARYERVFEKEKTTIGIPDHSYIVATLGLEE